MLNMEVKISALHAMQDFIQFKQQLDALRALLDTFAMERLTQINQRQ